ncbi:MAG: lysophospholipase [Cyanobacteria bacterium]|nr:lysophospholipase [Cyanobacteriota bacterium]
MVLEFTEEMVSGGRDGVLAYKWQDTEQSPRRILVLIHGLMMHGKVYESLARRLVHESVMVVAPDLRGFGRWQLQERGQSSLDYQGAVDDTGKLLCQLRKCFPSVPVVVAGESLGAHLARSVIAENWKIVSGLILSNPCIRPRMVAFDLLPYTVSEIVQSCMNKNREIDLTPFARRFLENEPESLNDYLKDPMSRKSLDILELIDSMLVVGSYKPPKIPSDMPVLVFRGSNDGVCRSASYNQFVSTIESTRMTVVRCRSCGHLILQGKNVDEEIVDIMHKWLSTV